MFGNLLRECGVLDSLSDTAQKVLANLITIILGLTVSSKMYYGDFLKKETLLILGLGLAAFVFDTVGGVLFAKSHKPVLQEQDKPDDRRVRYFGVPYVGACCQ